MKRVLSVALPDAAVRQLDAIAEREYRRPKDQASILLVRAIELASHESRSLPDVDPVESRR